MKVEVGVKEISKKKLVRSTRGRHGRCPESGGNEGEEDRNCEGIGLKVT